MHSVPAPHEAFETRVQALLDVPIRPEFSIEQAPSPQRLAPHAFTLTADAVTDGSSASVGTHVESASGRFVVLHDPDGVDEWEANDRIVIFARCDVEPELLADPLIHEVAWSWVTEALDNHEVAQLGGTVTVSSGTSFGSMAERPGDGLVEIRASWTPLEDDLTVHLSLWIEILATLAGLPPVPAGVATVGGRRATHT
ncbi:MAG: enoyl-CoA hydratase [Micrococcales bacterium]|nr:enoyl-CoA hydratase [Micrococcales bacterium]